MTAQKNTGLHAAAAIRTAIRATETAYSAWQRHLDAGGVDDGEMYALDQARRELEWALGGIDETGADQ